MSAAQQPRTPAPPRFSFLKGKRSTPRTRYGFRTGNTRKERVSKNAKSKVESGFLVWSSNQFFDERRSRTRYGGNAGNGTRGRRRPFTAAALPREPRIGGLPGPRG